MTFIRSPYIESVSDDTEVLSVVNGKIFTARRSNQLVTAFHPELNGEVSVHQYFVRMIEAQIQVKIQHNVKASQ